MDLEFINAMCDDAPKFNRRLCEGLSTLEMRNAETFIDKVMQAAAESFHGVTYHGYKRCTPEEQFFYTTKKRHGRRTFEHAHSSMYMLKMKFSIFGKTTIWQPLLMPYLERGNLFTLRNSRFTVSPTLADNLFSVDSESVFMPMTRSKVKFVRMMYHFMADGRTISGDVHHSRLHFTEKSKVPTGRFPTLMNYLFCMYGFTNVFSNLFDAEVKYGSREEINPDTYHESEYVICSSRGVSPTRRNYEMTDIQLAVRREDFERNSVKSAISAFFYILDHYSEREIVDEDFLEDTEFWKATLVFFTWKTIEAGQGLQQIENHLNSIGQYIDELVKNKLRYENIDVSTIDQLFVFIINNFSEMSIGSDVADTQGKQLQVVPIVLLDVIMMISQFMFQMQKHADPKRCTERNIRQCFAKFFKFNAAERIVRGHAEVESLDSATDCMISKVTANLVSQNKRSSKSKMSEMTDPAFALHPNLAISNTYTYITKSSPSARARANPFMNTGVNNEVLPIEGTEHIVEQAIKCLK